MFFSSYLMFFSIIVLTILFSLSSTSMFMIWVMLEINMMSVLPLLAAKGGILEGDVSLKYFISQSVASIIFIFLIAMGAQEMMFLELFFMAILFKLGLAPFHGWMLSIFTSSNYFNIFIIGTIQKIIPLHLLSLFYFDNYFLWGMMSINLMLVGALMWSQISIRLVLLLSSIVNSVWMLTAVNISSEWLSYMIIYASMNLSLIYFLSYFNISTLTQLSPLSAPLKISISLNFASLAGLPPFLGFIQKLVILKTLFLCSEFSMMFILILFSLCVLWVYLGVALALYALSENKQTETGGGLMCLFSGLILLLLPGALLI